MLRKKNLTWVTHCGMDNKERQNLSFDLTPYIQVFIDKGLWNKKKYRTEYNIAFEREDLERIKAVSIHTFTDHAPLSQFHNYEAIIEKFVPLESMEKTKFFSSAITDASKLAVIQIEFESAFENIPTLSYEQEKDIEMVMGQLAHWDAWNELQKLKSVICEFIQFFVFNLHLNFLTEGYEFSNKDKPELTGFTLVTEADHIYYETDRIDFLGHYILYEKEKDQLADLMQLTAKFWCKDFTAVHFFLDALKGNYISTTHFIKLVFAIESFFEQRISNDYMTLVVPLLTADNIEEMEQRRTLMRECFKIRNDIVHGGNLHGLFDPVKSKAVTKQARVSTMFYALKNVVTLIFYFFLRRPELLENNKYKLNHELIFGLLPGGLGRKNSPII